MQRYDLLQKALVWNFFDQIRYAAVKKMVCSNDELVIARNEQGVLSNSHAERTPNGKYHHK